MPEEKTPSKKSEPAHQHNAVRASKALPPAFTVQSGLALLPQCHKLFRVRRATTYGDLGRRCLGSRCRHSRPGALARGHGHGERTRVRWQEHAGVHWAYAGKEPVALGCVLEPDSERIIEPIWRPPLCGYASVCAGPWVQRI